MDFDLGCAPCVDLPSLEPICWLGRHDNDALRRLQRLLRLWWRALRGVVGRRRRPLPSVPGLRLPTTPRSTFVYLSVSASSRCDAGVDVGRAASLRRPFSSSRARLICIRVAVEAPAFLSLFRCPR